MARPQRIEHVLANNSVLKQEGGDWCGNVELNNDRIESRLNSTWNGDIWENKGAIINADTSIWIGDIRSNISYIDNYDLEGVWIGDIWSNADDIFNGGRWEGDVFTNDDYIANYYAGSIWNGDVQTNTGTILNTGTWNGDVLANTGTIVNIGTWNGSLTNSSSGTLQVGEGGAAGTILGNVANSGTLAFDHSDTSTFGGNISGTGVVTKSGAGTLILTGSAAHTGGTTISGGTLQIGNGGTEGTITGPVANAGTLIFNRTGVSSVTGVISGTGVLSKAGSGTLTLSANNSYSGATTLNAGILAVNGSIAASALTVNGGTLKGSGTVGTTTINSGTLAAGNSIGTLHVNGALTLGAGSVLEVEVSSGGNALGVNADLVAVNGTVTISSGASVEVKAENGTDDGKSYSADTTYTILTSLGRTGTFSAVSDNLAFLDSSLSYDASNAYLTLRRNDVSFAAIAETANQTGAATALGSFAPGDAVSTALVGLSEGEARRAYDLVSGDSHAASQTVMGQTMSLFQGAMGGGAGTGSGAVMSYLDAGAGLVGPVGSAEAIVSPIAPNAIWVTPIAGRGVADGDGNSGATEWAAGGLAMGYERQAVLAGGDVVAGLGLGYSMSTAKTPARLATSNAQGGQIGAYGKWSNAVAVLSGSLSYGANHVSSSRDIVIGPLQRTATAGYWMQGIDAALQAGYGFELSDGLKVGPLAGVKLGWSGHGGFSETGADSLNATVGATGSWRVETSLGVQFAYQLQGEADQFEISARALWLHNFADMTTQSTVALAGGGAPFTVASPASGRDRLELGLGATWSASDEKSVSLDYTGRFFGGQTEHIAKAGFTVGF